MEVFIHPDILSYNKSQTALDQGVCEALAHEIAAALPEAESKIWHRHPVWFLDGNPVAGYSKQKRGVRLMFWSGADFDEPALEVSSGKFRDASFYYNDPADINLGELRRWIGKSREVQWDYKNLVKRKGVLERLR